MSASGAGLQEGITSAYPPGPEGYTAYVIGDIHGRLDLLHGVHQQIERDKARHQPAQTIEIYLGDYIDRGPDSAGVVSRLIGRAREVRAVFLRGNHEQTFLNFCHGEASLAQWSAVGGLATLLSYGIAPGLLSRFVAPDVIRRKITEKVPEEHRAFYDQTGSYMQVGPYLAVHAGIRPGIDLAKQSTVDLLTIRREFLDFEGDLGCIVVHGHTPVMTPEWRRNRINIDTGAFATNLLTCLRIGADGVAILQDDGYRLLDRP
jgi:serine/threonine protein phosphatase 1